MKTIEEMREELEAMQASECRRVAVREQEHQRQLRRLERKRAVFCALSALVLLLGLVGLMAALPDVEGHHASPDVEDETWATDGDAGVIGKPMPVEPLKGQKRPPCSPDQEALSGGCWMEFVRKPGSDHCGGTYEHGGKCYVPVQQAQRIPTSVEP